MKKLSIYLSIYLSIFLASYNEIASAEAVYTECNTCSTSFSYYSAANNVVERSSTTIFVGNHSSKTIKKFHVQYEHEIGETIIWEENVSQFERESFNSMSASRENFLTYLAGPGVLPNEIASSGYELIGRSYKQNQVRNWFVNNQGVTEFVSGYIGAVLNIAGKITGVTWNFEIRFSDGSKAGFKLTGLNADLSFKLDLNYLIDQYGNNIPLEASGYSDQVFLFESHSEALLAFLEAVDRIGVRFVRIDAIMPSSGTVIIKDLKCEKVGTKWECHEVSQNNDK
ncbi:MAG: hypothetical protein ACK4GU_15785 [Alishewanella aestuarii]